MKDRVEYAPGRSNYTRGSADRPVAGYWPAGHVYLFSQQRLVMCDWAVSGVWQCVTGYTNETFVIRPGVFSIFAIDYRDVSFRTGLNASDPGCRIGY